MGSWHAWRRGVGVLLVVAALLASPHFARAEGLGDLLGEHPRADSSLLGRPRLVDASAILVPAHTADKGWDYPWECCSSTDCWQMTKLTEPPPVATPQGWRLYDGTVVAYADTRPSPDGDWHTCRKGGALSGQVIRPEGKKACLWVPAGI